jgi:hypothetical protein
MAFSSARVVRKKGDCRMNSSRTGIALFYNQARPDTSLGPGIPEPAALTVTRIDFRGAPPR